MICDFLYKELICGTLLKTSNGKFISYVIADKISNDIGIPPVTIFGFGRIEYPSSIEQVAALVGYVNLHDDVQGISYLSISNYIHELFLK